MCVHTAPSTDVILVVAHYERVYCRFSKEDKKDELLTALDDVLHSTRDHKFTFSPIVNALFKISGGKGEVVATPLNKA